MVGITSRMQIARLRVIVLIGYLCLCLVFYENLITILYFLVITVTIIDRKHFIHSILP